MSRSNIFFMHWFYLMTSVAQRFTLWALDVEVPGSIPGRDSLELSFLIGSDLSVLGSVMSSFRCSGNHSAWNFLVWRPCVVWHIVIINIFLRRTMLRNETNMDYLESSKMSMEICKMLLTKWGKWNCYY